MTDATAEILAIEEQRCQAELNGDIAALERLLDDSLVYVHASGGIDSKSDVIALRQKMKFLKMERRGLKVQVSGDLAVMTGELSIEARVNGVADLIKSDMFVTQALARRSGQWRFTVFQATALKK